MRYIKAFLITIAIVIFLNNINAQTVVLNGYFPDSIPSKWGPNLKHYAHFYIDYGVFVDPSSKKFITSEVSFSDAFVFGVRYKLRIAQFYAMGLAVELGSDNFKMKNNFLTKAYDEKEIFKIYNTTFEYYNRINFGRRGNHLGKYIDFGVFGKWNFNPVNIYKKKIENNWFKKSKTVLSGIDYFEPFVYGVKIRLGFNRYVISGSYRLNQLVSEEGADFPKILVGLQIGLHK